MRDAADTRVTYASYSGTSQCEAWLEELPRDVLARRRRAAALWGGRRQGTHVVKCRIVGGIADEMFAGTPDECRRVLAVLKGGQWRTSDRSPVQLAGL